MNRKILWLLVSCLAALSLVLPSCAPAVTEEEKVEEEAVEEEKEVEEEVVEEKEEKPKYGGKLTDAFLNDVFGFDQVYLAAEWTLGVEYLTNDRLTIGDWTRGAVGTNEVDLAGRGWMMEGIFHYIGSLGECEIPDDQTLIYKIRQGVYFGLNPDSEASRLVNGREMTAEDVVFSIKYMYLNPKVPLAYNVITAPGGKKLTDAYVDPNDPWKVIVKVEGVAWGFFEDLGVKGVHIIPHEVIEKYGDLRNWRNAVGTGGFFLTDYVPGSSINFVRNPNYWRTNPIGPGKGDQLPYVDTIKVLIIIDRSTVIAAFRTGKLDRLSGSMYFLSWSDIQGILKTNPQTKVKSMFSNMAGLGIRLTSTDPLAAPLMKQRVRWALNMAIDREEMVRDLYSGQAIPFVLWFAPNSPYFNSPADMAEILETVHGIKPEEAIMVKKMFEYHPDEARKILAEEGYPNGFKTVVICAPQHIDFLSVIKNYFAKIGVDLALDVREYHVYKSVIDKHLTQAMFWYGIDGAMGTTPAKFVFYGPGDPTLPFTVSNRWELSHPVIDDYIAAANANYGWDIPKQMRLLQEASAYITWLTPWVAAPQSDSYAIWHPWLKNYYGFDTMGFRNHGNALYFAWLDQDLKKEMGR